MKSNWCWYLIKFSCFSLMGFKQFEKVTEKLNKDLKSNKNLKNTHKNNEARLADLSPDFITLPDLILEVIQVAIDMSTVK